MTPVDLVFAIGFTCGVASCILINLIFKEIFVLIELLYNRKRP